MICFISLALWPNGQGAGLRSRRLHVRVVPRSKGIDLANVWPRLPRVCESLEVRASQKLDRSREKSDWQIWVIAKVKPRDREN